MGRSASSTTMRPGSRLTTTTWTALVTGSSIRTVGGVTAISCACMASFRCALSVVVIVSSFPDQLTNASFQRDEAIGDRLAVQDFGHLVGLIGLQQDRLRGDIQIAFFVGEQLPGVVGIDQETEPAPATGGDVVQYA